MQTYYDKVRAATQEALDAYHAAHPKIPRNLHSCVKTWGETRVMLIADQRILWINQYIRENYPELIK